MILTTLPSSFGYLQIAAFWSKVEVLHVRQCWIWDGSKSVPGYGRVKIDGRSENAHRVAYLIAHGAIEDGLSVLHQCDVRSCVNPTHLRKGTHQENMQECFDRGRMPHLAIVAKQGKRHGSSKLTPEQVADIRSRNAMPRKALAEMFGVSQWTIYYILQGKAWKHVTKEAV